LPRVAVLGGAGAVGSAAVKALAASRVFSEMVIADANVERARALASELVKRGVSASASELDARDLESVKAAARDADVVVNCVGPFYEFGPGVLRAVIEAGVDYVDVCDDVDATAKMLEMNVAAREAGITALIGMGVSPGIANVMVKYCAERLLDEVEAVDIYHAHGGEPIEGPGVVKHRIHSMLMEVPVFLDGELRYVRLFDESGRALEEEVDFCGLGTYRAYVYPHPETITLPRYIKGVRRVTNKGLVLPPGYAELIKNVVKLGLTTDEPLEVQGHLISPLEFAVAFIIKKREEILKKAGLTRPVGCLKIVVSGRKGGKLLKYIFSLASVGAGTGMTMQDATGLAAALGAVLMAQGRIKGPGVLPPEACVNPDEFLALLKASLGVEKFGGEGSPVRIECVDEAGRVKAIEI